MLVEQWFKHYGAPKEVHSDEDVRIWSDTRWYKRVLDALNVHVTTGVPYTQTSNPLCERQNSNLPECNAEEGRGDEAKAQHKTHTEHYSKRFRVVLSMEIVLCCSRVPRVLEQNPRFLMKQERTKVWVRLLLCALLTMNSQ